MSRIYALSSVKFQGLNLRLCKKNDKYQVCLLVIFFVFVCLFFVCLFVYSFFFVFLVCLLMGKGSDNHNHYKGWQGKWLVLGEGGAHNKQRSQSFFLQIFGFIVHTHLLGTKSN